MLRMQHGHRLKRVRTGSEGLPGDRWLKEDDSTSTRQNALYSLKLAQEHGYVAFDDSLLPDEISKWSCARVDLVLPGGPALQ